MVAMTVYHHQHHRTNTSSSSTSSDGQVPTTTTTWSSSNQLHGPVVEEIQGLIKVYKDGHTERPQIVPSVPPTLLPPDLPVTCKDVIIDPFTNVWARLYVPLLHHDHDKLIPLLVYFHGGGFCVGSAAWSCYHDFLANLAAKASCLVLSVNYRLAPENPLPAAYDDGVKALSWVKTMMRQEEAALDNNNDWARKCDFNNIFLGGDSAGANIAHNVSGLIIRRSSDSLLMAIKGTILIQPFFGGHARTASEKNMTKKTCPLTLDVSDTYWRLSLPEGANRDHPWSNPTTTMLFSSGGGLYGKLDNSNNNNNNNVMVCIAEMDILKDRNMEFCDALGRAGKRVERMVYNGVGHAFHVLDKTQISTTRTTQLISHIKAFIASLAS
ncbi:probable carboxylesterase 6 [Impatiens glandulifera]|uniref:probable carboxylesterase 6 n=1 Tax=Impatiens glandulifera TaxID=253017 RepID=UPI001FB1A1A3|nr:probable carboxylesterase 6 [Impatiens glandulifera]